jgi:phosphoglycolate phosphatase
VAHTESNLYAAIGRLKRLRVIDFFKRIYCRERSTIAHPNQRAAQDWLETIDRYKPKELSHQQRKPNVDVLLEICRDQACSPDEAAYVGDSLARDVLMAHDAGVFSIWAKYGVAHNTEYYERLVRITHWTNDDIEREKRLRGRTRALQPDLVLERNFSEVLGAFQLADESRPPDLRKRNAS